MSDAKNEKAIVGALMAKVLDDYRNGSITQDSANRHLKKLSKRLREAINPQSSGRSVNPLHKGTRGPITGKPKPYEAEIVRLANSDISRRKLIKSKRLEYNDADLSKKIRRIIFRLEDATKNRFSRAMYEKGINSKLLQELHNGNNVNVDDYLHIFSANWDPNEKGSYPELLTKKEVFERLDDAHMAAIKAITGKEPD